MNYIIQNSNEQDEFNNSDFDDNDSYSDNENEPIKPKNKKIIRKKKDKKN